MTIMVSFNANERRSKNAIRKVTEECEQFLKDLKELGMDITQLKGGANSVSKTNYSDEDSTDASRRLEWDADYDLKMIDTVMKLSEKESYDVDIHVSPRYSNREKLRKELMSEAVLDAKKTAELLVEPLGSKIKGPGKINASNDDYFSDDNYIADGAGTAYMLKEAPETSELYTTLKNPTMVETEEITIEWELEE